MCHFKFKQFSIKQDQTAMKVGTDGVLLGAWVDTKKPQFILDIGTGTGLLAIMLAQKYPYATIKAVEIETQAAQQASENVANSKWANNIEIYNIDFFDFCKINEHKYNLIISNPPFFENVLQNKDEKKSIARHNSYLPFGKFIKNTKKILADNGKFCVVIPSDIHQHFIHLCSQNILFCNKKLFIRHTDFSPPKRVLLEFSNKITFTDEKYLSVKEESNYSSDFQKLTKEYYLSFS